MNGRIIYFRDSSGKSISIRSSGSASASSEDNPSAVFAEDTITLKLRDLTLVFIKMWLTKQSNKTIPLLPGSLWVGHFNRIFVDERFSLADLDENLEIREKIRFKILCFRDKTNF